MQLRYTTVGHVTVDVLADGSRRPGGSAFYSALQASRLGLQAAILTRGVAREIEAMLEPYRDELQLTVLAAPHTTTLQTHGAGAARRQRVLAWAGPIDTRAAPRALDTSILHLAPVAAETPATWEGEAAFVGLTPQGLARDWSERDPWMRLRPPPASALAVADRCHALVLSQLERDCCRALIERAAAHGAVVAVTAGAQPTTLLSAGGAQTIAVPALAGRHDDLGAGDVFAATFFAALAEGADAPGAVRLGNAAAALRMTGSGLAAVARRAAIEARMRADAAPLSATPPPATR